MEAPVPQMLILFYGGTSLIDRAIKWATHSPYSHTALVVRNILYEEQAPGLILWAGSGAPRRAGEAVAYKVVPLTDPQETAVVAFLKQTVEQGGRYDYAALLNDALDRFSHGRIEIELARNNAWDCSAVCTQCLIYCDQVPPKDARLMSPQDLADWQAPLTAGAPPLP